MSAKEYVTTKGRDALLGPPCLCLGWLFVVVGYWVSNWPAGLSIEFLTFSTFFHASSNSSSNFPDLSTSSQFQVLRFILFLNVFSFFLFFWFNSFKLKYNCNTFTFLPPAPPKFPLSNSFHIPLPLSICTYINTAHVQIHAHVYIHIYMYICTNI